MILRISSIKQENHAYLIKIHTLWARLSILIIGVISLLSTDTRISHKCHLQNDL